MEVLGMRNVTTLARICVRTEFVISNALSYRQIVTKCHQQIVGTPDSFSHIREQVWCHFAIPFASKSGGRLAATPICRNLKFADISRLARRPHTSGTPALQADRVRT